MSCRGSAVGFLNDRKGSLDLARTRQSRIIAARVGNEHRRRCTVALIEACVSGAVRSASGLRQSFPIIFLCRLLCHAWQGVDIDLDTGEFVW